MVKTKLSVFIITKNEELRVARTLASVQNLADEILVVDSGSTDKTVEIAKEFGAKVIFNEWPGYGQQKFFAQQQCKNDWVLNLDADEVLTDALQEEIAELLASDTINAYHGYKINICEIPHFPTRNSKFNRKKLWLQLYNKRCCSYRQSSVHDVVLPTNPEKISVLQNYIEHRSIQNYQQEIAKINRYSDHLGAEFFSKGKTVSAFKLLIMPHLAFLKHYLLRGHFLYGVNGIVASRIYAFSRLLKYAKIREQYWVNARNNLGSRVISSEARNSTEGPKTISNSDKGPSVQFLSGAKNHSGTQDTSTEDPNKGPSIQFLSSAKNHSGTSVGNPKLRILNLMFCKKSGGIQQMFCNYNLALRHKEHEVLNIINKAAQVKTTLQQQGATFREIGNCSKFDILAIYQLRKLLKNYQPDIIITHGNRATSLCSAAKPQAKILAVAHNEKIKTLLKADGVIIVSEYLRAVLEQQDYPKEQIFHLANFIN